jgi:uncharacterized repeat protein (TIGR01451 family)
VHRLSIDKELVAVNGVPYVSGMVVPPNALLRYRITYANTGPYVQTNVIVSDTLPTQRVSVSNFAVIRGPNILPATGPNAQGLLTFATIPVLPALTGGVVEFDLQTNAQNNATVTNTGRVRSAQLPTDLTDAVSVTISSAQGNLAVAKSMQVHDPQNLGLKAIPGNDVVYTIQVTNPGPQVDSSAIVVTDPLPAQLIFFRGPFDANTPEPILFQDGTPASGLTCCTSAHISYSTDGGNNYSYLAPGTYDPAITHIRVQPAGPMPSGSVFRILFRAKIK